MRAADLIRWAATMPVPSGDNAGESWTVPPWQRRLLAAVVKPGVQVIAATCSRGNGKTAVAALIARAYLPGGPLYEPGAEVLVVSASHPQARLVIDDLEAWREDGWLVANSWKAVRRLEGREGRSAAPRKAKPPTGLDSDRGLLASPNRRERDQLEAVPLGPWPSTRVSGIRDDSAALGALELALGRPERDTSYVRCTGRRLRRAGSPQPRPGTGPRIAPNTACRRPCLVPSRSRHGLGSGGAADARSMAPDDDRTWLGRP